MPMMDFDCRGCGRRFEALVGGPNDFPAPVQCDCGSGAIERVWTFNGHVSETKHYQPGEVYMHLKNKKDLEKHAANGTLIDLKERGPLEFRPEIPKTLH